MPMYYLIFSTVFLFGVTHTLPIYYFYLDYKRRLLRLLKKNDYFPHIQSLFKEICCLKLFDLNKLQIAIHMYKLVKRVHITTFLLHHNYPTRICVGLRVPQHDLTIFSAFTVLHLKYGILCLIR